MKINELEKLLNINRANIRFYEKEGLLTPARKENGYREFDEKEVTLLKKIIIYRKLGISIPDIKSIFNGENSLCEAVAKNIVLMQNEITTLNVSIELCKEISNKKLDDSDFDEEFYWNEINRRESLGEEFLDVAGIDITGFKNKKKIKSLIIIFCVLFFGGIIYSFICNSLYSNDVEYYDKTYNEIDTYSEIETVKADLKNEMLYVCYAHSLCVNVYDFDGVFKWAVAVPTADNSAKGRYFYLVDDRLMVECDGNIYVYNSLNGEFFEMSYAEKAGVISLRENYEEYCAEDLQKNTDLGFAFDSYNVYTIAPNGVFTGTIVEKPDWYMLTNYVWGILIAGIGATGTFIISILSALKKYGKAPVDKRKIGKTANAMVNCFKILFAVCLGYSILNIILLLCGHNFTVLGIFPLVVLFTIIYLINDILSKRFNDTEKRACIIWRNYTVYSFAVAIISILITMFFSGSTLK